MEDITFVKQIPTTSNCSVNNSLVIRLEFPIGTFSISQKLADILNVDNKSGLMFSFNQKDKTGYVIKDDAPDCFILRRKNKNCLRFTSKDLQFFFIKTFDFLQKGKKTFYFNVSSIPDEKGRYAITWMA
jgi:hypothetical protein